MKIQVKTLNQKSLLVEIDAQKTVLDLKQELALYPDIGVEPGQQKLIYAGKILDNAETLNDCKIDEKKFLVVMIVKQQQQQQATAVAVTNEVEAAASSASTEKKDESPTATKTTTPTATAASTPAQATSVPQSEQDEMVSNIVSMGYAESDVRQALEASFNNPERAVEYLIEGIPMSPSAGEVSGGGFAGFESEEGEMSPFELLRSDPVFRNLRSLIQQNPELIDEAVQRISEANPALLTIINDHHQEFLNMLFEQVDDDEDVDE